MTIPSDIAATTGRTPPGDLAVAPRQAADRAQANEAPGEAAIEARDLVRRFGDFTAVDHLSFRVRHGEVFGFLGPNGAGKSTTIKMLCTLLTPTEGIARVNGFDVAVSPARVRQSIGIIFQDFSLDDRITAEENLQFHCMIYHVPPRERATRIRRMLEMVDLADRAKDVVRQYSGGMKRRLEIARGLLHHPRVLFLDEPTVGLDPQTRQNIWEHIHELRKREGITVFMTTHYMDEAENCDRIGVMDHSRLIALDTPLALKASLGGDVVRLRTADNAAAIAVLRERWGLAPTEEDSQLRFEVEHGDTFVPALLRDFPIGVQSLDIARPTLNDVFLQLTGRAIREESSSSVERLRGAMRRRGGRGA
ncbi:MAG TPA: ATP-binding cassette domain-containing protein [Ktedonobacterales bacterium]|nr:ATP-binding cassette domain-containing protein [Ktedonobacterales bacterium]